MSRRQIAAPRVAPAVDLLAKAIPDACPEHGCAVQRIAVVAGGDDRRPIVEVTFTCGRVVSVPEAAR